MYTYVSSLFFYVLHCFSFPLVLLLLLSLLLLLLLLLLFLFFFSKFSDAQDAQGGRELRAVKISALNDAWLYQTYKKHEKSESEFFFGCGH